jgi:hypothetical protein
MATKLLTEIERYRELMGVQLLKEMTIPKTFFASFAEAFGKTEDDFFETLLKSEDEIFDASERLLKQEFNDIAELAGRDLDDFIKQLKAGSSSISDDVLDTLAFRLLKSSDPKIATTTTEAFIKEYPSLTMLKSALDDTEYMTNILKSGDKKSIENLNALKKKINELNIGDLTKKYFTDIYDESYKVAKAEVDRIAAETSEKFAKEAERLKEASDELASKSRIEEGKKTKASDLRKQMDLLVQNNKLPKNSDEYTTLTDYIDNLLKDNPNADLGDLAKLGEQQFDILYIKYQKAVQEGAEATQEFWRGAGKKLRKYLNYLNLGRNAKNPTTKVIVNMLGYASIIAVGYGATSLTSTLLFGSDLSPEELELLKKKITNNLGSCVSTDKVTVRFIETKNQSDSDVFDPDAFGKAVVDVFINGKTETLEFSEGLKQFVMYGTQTNPINCETTPGLGVGKGATTPATPTTPTTPTTDGVLTDDEILALWKSVNPDGEKRGDGLFYKTKESSIDYSYDPATKTFK